MATIIPLADVRAARAARRARDALARRRERAASPPGRVADTRGRPLRDLRISVTDRCNFRCVYCMPKDVFGRDYPFLPHAELLTFEEIARARARLRRRAASRRSASPAASRCCAGTSSGWSRCSAKLGDLDLTLTTNGALLAQKARGARRRGLDARHREPRFARRRDVPRDERRRLSGRARCSKASTPRRRRGSRRSRSTWW